VIRENVTGTEMALNTLNGPWVVSRIKVFSVSAMLSSLRVGVKVPNLRNRNSKRSAGNGAAHCFGKWHRRADVATSITAMRYISRSIVGGLLPIHR